MKPADLSALVMPRVLARPPFDSTNDTGFGYEEAPFDEFGVPKEMIRGDYCWTSAAYILAARMAAAFARHGWCTAIQGLQGAELSAACRCTCTYLMTETRQSLVRPRQTSAADAREQTRGARLLVTVSITETQTSPRFAPCQWYMKVQRAVRRNRSRGLKSSRIYHV